MGIDWNTVEPHQGLAMVSASPTDTQHQRVHLQVLLEEAVIRQSGMGTGWTSAMGRKQDAGLRLVYMGKPGRLSRPMRWETARVGRAHGNDFRLQPRLPREDGKVLKR